MDGFSGQPLASPCWEILANGEVDVEEDGEHNGGGYGVAPNVTIWG